MLKFGDPEITHKMREANKLFALLQNDKSLREYCKLHGIDQKFKKHKHELERIKDSRKEASLAKDTWMYMKVGDDLKSCKKKFIERAMTFHMATFISPDAE